MIAASTADRPQSLIAENVTIPMTVAEYFAGIGLFRMGLEAAGWQVVYSNDWSSERAQMYQGFFGECEHYEVKDIFAVDCQGVPSTTLATCSFPCIDLSLAGKGEGINGKHSGAFWGFHQILKEQGCEAPPIVLLENVPGWLYSNEGRDFHATAKALNDIGYACDVFMLNARSFLPQSRPRLFMIGIKDVEDADHVALMACRSNLLAPSKLKARILECDDIQWTWLNVPEPPPYRNNGFSNEIVEDVPFDDARWWPVHKVEKHLAMMPALHLAKVKRMAREKIERYRTFFRRVRRQGQRAEVRSDDIAGCLRTAIGGSGKQFLIAAGNDAVRMRTLTPREYARLQGVPDSFPIVANTDRQSFNAFGDAVCVPAVSWIATQVLHPLIETLRTGRSEL